MSDDTSACKMSTGTIEIDLDPEEMLLNTSGELTSADISKIMLKFIESEKKKRLDLVERFEKLESNIAEITWAEQSKLRNNICVIGLAPSVNENLHRMIIDLCAFFGIQIGPEDMKDIYRVQKSNRIIACFTKFDTKSQLMAAKMAKKVTVGNVWSSASTAETANKEIFINCQLTRTIARLVQRGHAAVKKRKLAACWVATKGLMVQSVVGSNPIVVRTIEELKKLVGSPTSMDKKCKTLPVKANVSSSPSDDNRQPKAKFRSEH